jgi:hypothetical protein
MVPGDSDAEGNTWYREEEDEDENLGRVGSLARGKPIFPFTETLRHRFGAHLGLR